MARIQEEMQHRVNAVAGTSIATIDLPVPPQEMCLVPGVRIPTKLKFPYFEKYKGERDHKTHIRSYCLKIVVYFDDERLLMHFFQDSLSGASLEWYMQLEGNHIRSWRDIVEAFLKHYQYNTDMAPNYTQLQNLTQKSDETFKEYTQCWRELATGVQPHMLERELVDMFMGNIQGPYLDRMVGSTFFGFPDLVITGERIENMIKMGNIQNASSTSSVVKKPYVAYGGNTNIPCTL
ncbi:uncharacterized protein LOC127103738 [Lathyrus oleraceus]|uniref:uncharacterized protein LOC127103738 n=1 Tax=Pisum sativum TaxID=3888 RepID=UPI0021D0D213|nr:uncharacterized protein LOC127103738 [Pisum sativum]